MPIRRTTLLQIYATQKYSIEYLENDLSWNNLHVLIVIFGEDYFQWILKA